MRDTIDMAREAGWKDLRDYDSEMRHDFFMGNTDSLKAFEALVRADEREACHALRQTLPNPHEHCQVSAHAYDMALVAYGAAIRKRGETK